jgi:hypothetical protein
MVTYSKFFHSIPKDPEDMTLDELNDEMESCKDWEQECIKIGQGIQSKENLRERRVKSELTSRYAKIRLDGETLSIGKYGDITGDSLITKLNTYNQKFDNSVQQKFLDLACRLEPENLYMDGEASPSEARRRKQAIRREWKNLESLVGRPVSEDEVWKRNNEKFTRS